MNTVKKPVWRTIMKTGSTDLVALRWRGHGSI